MKPEDPDGNADSEPGTSTISWFRRGEAIGSVGAAAVGVAGLLGYVPRLRALGSIRPEYIPMAPSTAVCFLILSLALFFQGRRPWEGAGLKTMFVLIVLVQVFGLLKVVENLTGMDLTFEGRLTRGSGALGQFPVGQMSPAAGAAFMVAGLGALLHLLRSRSSRHSRRLGHGVSSLGALTALIGTTVVLAYLYGAPLMYRGTAVPMAATTAGAFLFLGAALVGAGGPSSFPMNRITGDSTSARLLRIFLPLTVGVVVAQSVLSRFLSESSLVNNALFVACLVTVTGAITAAVVARIARWIGSSLDESNRKRLESEERHQSILRTALVGFWLTDRDGRLLEVNGTYCRMSGYTGEELLAMRISELEAVETADDTTAHIQRIIAQGEGRFESQHRRKDGSIFQVEVSAQYLSNEGGRFVVFLQDITQRKGEEAEREKLQGQLIQAQKMESVGRLAGGVAHDFNNMLSVILGHSEMALETTDPATPLFGALQEIHKAAERSANLTRQLLAFARKQTVAPKVLDLNHAVESMLQMLRRLIGEDIDLAWKPGAGVWPVRMDPSQVDQIMANLCVNARDAISGVGRVTIETGNAVFDTASAGFGPEVSPGDYVLLTVSDNGCGMSKETLGKIFEPFFTTKEKSGGTGLGLATVYGIIKQNNGFINVYSDMGNGTTFRIYLPRHAVAAESNPEEGAAAPAARGAETILLVEDEPAILNLAASMLRPRGYTVLAASTPGEAIRLATEHAGQIDLLLTDVVMPEMNGRDLAKNLMSLRPGLRRLFMSGYTADVIAHRGVLDEGVHFIGKPFSMRDLAAKVREALDG